MLTVALPGPPDAALGLRERKKLAARAAIVEAALELFAERGYDETTVAEVAERADLSPATVARYFASKESMLFAERDQRTSSLRDTIVGRPADEPPLTAVIRGLAEQPWSWGESELRLRRMRVAIARSATLRGRASGLLGEWRRAVAEALAVRGLPDDEARVLACAVVAVLDDASDRWARLDDGGSVADAVTNDLRALGRVLGGGQLDDRVTARRADMTPTKGETA